jgi:hypothetical protein
MADGRNRLTATVLQRHPVGHGDLAAVRRTARHRGSNKSARKPEACPIRPSITNDATRRPPGGMFRGGMVGAQAARQLTYDGHFRRFLAQGVGLSVPSATWARAWAAVRQHGGRRLRLGTSALSRLGARQSPPGHRGSCPGAHRRRCTRSGDSVPAQPTRRPRSPARCEGTSVLRRPSDVAVERGRP